MGDLIVLATRMQWLPCCPGQSSLYPHGPGMGTGRARSRAVPDTKNKQKILKTKLLETESRMADARGWEWGYWRNVGQRSLETPNSENLMHNLVIIITTVVLYMWKFF